MTSNSLWPLLTSLSVFGLLFSFYFSVINMNLKLLYVSMVFVMFSSTVWFRNLIRESLLLGSQNLYMQSSLKFGMIFFILSEIFFFISFFWTYFHYMFSQGMELGLIWPPLTISSVDYKSVPLFNSLLLLSSGVAITVSHNYLSMGYDSFKKFLFFTIILGVIFTYCQYWEYNMLTFIWSDSCFGSIFFMGTGFHGVHVILGSLVLFSVFIRSTTNNIFLDSTVFEMGAWYWHFVDVVWIILFTEFYWWS